MSDLEEVARSGGLQGALSLVVAHYFSGGQPILDSFEKLVVDIGKLIPELPELKVQLPTRQDGHARAPSPPSRASPPRLRAPPPPASRSPPEPVRRRSVEHHQSSVDILRSRISGS